VSPPAIGRARERRGPWRGTGRPVPLGAVRCGPRTLLLDGAAQLLADADVLTLQAGDLAVVPPGMAHAFAAPTGATADLLIVITPGVERFEYVRLTARFAQGQTTLEDLLAVQDRFDNHFIDSPEWRAARS
jgi:hypothetical protein